MNLLEYKTSFDVYLEKRLEIKLSEVEWYFPDKKTFDLLTYLKPYVDHGKRFRPYMVYLWYSLYWGDDVEFILKVGLVHELIHIFALIHDDICDKGTIRHSINSYHQELSNRYQDDHIWITQAMLIWDLVYTRALQESEQLMCWTKAHKIVFEMLNEVVIWQMLDVDFSVDQESIKSLEQITNKDHLKSGQYTFQKPLLVWASLAWNEDLDSLALIWKKLWIAFQMRDDLLDWIPNKEWKTKMSDIQEGNQTVVLLSCREMYDTTARERLLKLRWRKLSENSLSILKNDFESFSIQEVVTSKIISLLNDVEADFNKLGLESSAIWDFKDIIELLRSVN